jgi:hypothetical protein
MFSSSPSLSSLLLAPLFRIVKWWTEFVQTVRTVLKSSLSSVPPSQIKSIYEFNKKSLAIRPWPRTARRCLKLANTMRVLIAWLRR